MSIFAALATMGVVLISDVSRVRQKVEMEEYLYTESQALLERMARTVQASAINYEEYFSRYALSETEYGLQYQYNYYYAEFFDGSYEKFQNPALGNEEDANAMCQGGSSCSSTIDYHQVDELYLINGSGNESTYFALEEDLAANEAMVAVLEMEGADTGGDGIIDTWICTDDFTCTGTAITSPSGNLPDTGDLSDGIDNDNFVPISPSSIVIDSLTFYISPIEDPYKALMETNTVYESVQNQPHVTIVMTAHYSGSVPLGSSSPEITLQTTIGTGVFSNIRSYSP